MGLEEMKISLEDILKEILYADELKVKVAGGKIVAIPKQVIQRPKKNGITTQQIVEETIEIEG